MASVLITGTSKDIGFESALAFGRKGHAVHATMRNPSCSSKLTETPGGYRLTPYDPEFERQLILAEQIMHDDRDVLRALSK